MGKQFQLGWYPARRCWKKFRDGKTYYLGQGKCRAKYDMKGYNAAWEEWQEIERTLNVKRLSTQMFAQGDEAEQILLAGQRQSYYADNPLTPTYEERREIEQAVETVRRMAIAVPRSKTIRALADSFLERKKSQANVGQKSKGRFVNLRSYVDKFVAFVGAEKHIEEITAITLADYHSKLLTSISNEEIGFYGARDAMQSARQFIRYCWEMGVIDLPRNLDSKDLDISATAGEIDLFDFSVLRTILKDAPDIYEKYPLKLYLYLMANCGMTQQDISDLTHAQIDIASGTITRKRSKTKQWKDAPKVCHQLWPITLELLKKHRNEKSARALTNPEGGILAGTTLNGADNGASKVDFIAKMYNAWCDDVKIGKADRKTLKAIRKTSASKVGEHKEFGKYAQYFLAQSAKTVADKHYVVPSQKDFNACLKWLGIEYGAIAAFSRKRRSWKA